MSYVLRRSEDGGLELWRSETPRLPESLDREFPAAGSDGEALLADGIARLRPHASSTTSCEPKTSWDSSSLVDASELPAGVEIQLAMAEPGQRAAARGADDPSTPRAARRAPARPRGDARRASAGDEADEDKDDLAKKTVCDCIDCAALAANPSTARLIQEIGGQPAAGLAAAPSGQSCASRSDPNVSSPARPRARGRRAPGRALLRAPAHEQRRHLRAPLDGGCADRAQPRRRGGGGGARRAAGCSSRCALLAEDRLQELAGATPPGDNHLDLGRASPDSRS